ncbi:MAG: hypothetical protein ACI9S8_000608 [Chlamydiales bacterium]|jgi:hypothetical protein
MVFDTNINSLTSDSIYKILEDMEPADVVSLAMSDRTNNAFSKAFEYLSETSESLQKDLRTILKEMNILSPNRSYSIQSIFDEAMKMESQFKKYFPELAFTGNLSQRCRQIHEKIPQINNIRTYSIFRKAAASGEIQSVKRILQESFLEDKLKSRGLYAASNRGHLDVVVRILEDQEFFTFQ